MLGLEREKVTKKIGLLSCEYNWKLSESEMNVLVRKLIGVVRSIQKSRYRLIEDHDGDTELAAEARTVLVIMNDILQNVSDVDPTLMHKIHALLHQFLPEITQLFESKKTHQQRLGLDCLFILAGLFQFKVEESRMALQVVAQHPQLVLQLLRLQETTAKAAFLLVYMDAVAPEMWEGEESLHDVLTDFFVSLQSSFELVSQALTPIRVFRWGIYDQYVLRVLPYMGFSRFEQETMESVWDAATMGWDLEGTVATVWPNIQTMIAMERTYPGMVVELHRSFGITQFMRFLPEVYLQQHALLTQEKSQRPKMIWDISMQMDFGNAIRNSKQQVYTHERIADLKDSGMQLVSIELGGTVSEMEQQLDKLVAVLGQPCHVVFSTHTNTKGLMQKYIQDGPFHVDADGTWINSEDHWEVIPYSEFASVLAPALERVVATGGSITLDSCVSSTSAAAFQKSVVKHSGAERSVLADIVVTDHLQIEPKFSILTD